MDYRRRDFEFRHVLTPDVSAAHRNEAILDLSFKMTKLEVSKSLQTL